MAVYFTCVCAVYRHRLPHKDLVGEQSVVGCTTAFESLSQLLNNCKTKDGYRAPANPLTPGLLLLGYEWSAKEFSIHKRYYACSFS
jgi:hypothetical protein